ncbi:MAG: PQQ-dependent sugar dehydrogenase, partial [Pseudomonadota bacterium]
MMKGPAILGLLAGLGLQACGGSGGGSAQIVVAPETPAPPTGPPTQLGTERVFSMLSFDQPLALVQAPDSDAVWYVVERAGRVWMFENRPDVSSASLFADLSAQIESGPGEAGLLGLAFDPEYVTNRGVFVSYTRNSLGLESVVARMETSESGMMLDPTTEIVLLTVPQDFTNHNGGQIQFGPDGFLYVGLGDGGSGNDPNDRAQDTTNLLGSIARLDVSAGDEYAIPPDNAFAGNPRCADGFGAASCPEIFAYGLRNPWRFSFDRTEGTLWAGDVGQDRFEEIKRITVGGNYGWRVREASACNIPSTECETDGLLDPVAF